MSNTKSPENKEAGNWKLRGAEDRARYRIVSTRIYNDAKFLSLSADAQRIFTHMLWHPDSTSIPGLSPLRETTAAAVLRLSLIGYQIGYRELFEKGMAEADWEAGVVFIPNAFKYDAPNSPKVVSAWRSLVLNYLPESPLVNKAILHIYRGLMAAYAEPQAFDKAMKKAFPALFLEASAIPLPIPYPIPYQKPYPAQDPGSSTQDPGGGGDTNPRVISNGATSKEALPKAPPPPPEVERDEGMKAHDRFQAIRKAKGLLAELPPSNLEKWSIGTLAELKGQGWRHPPGVLEQAMLAFFEDSKPYWADRGFPWSAFAKQWDTHVPPCRPERTPYVIDGTEAERLWGQVLARLVEHGKDYCAERAGILVQPVGLENNTLTLATKDARQAGEMLDQWAVWLDWAMNEVCPSVRVRIEAPAIALRLVSQAS